MNLAAFHSLVSQEARRGNSLDAVIPRRVQMAARYLEKTYNFAYMENLFTIILDPDNDDPRVVQVPLNIKSIRWIRIPNEVGEYAYLKKVDPSEVTAQTTGFPVGYFLSGPNYIVFDSVVEESYYAEGWGKLYTAWPEADLDASPWLVDNATDALLCKSMEFICQHLRDYNGLAMFKTQFQDIAKSLVIEDEEKRWDGADLQLGYTQYFPLSD